MGTTTEQIILQVDVQANNSRLVDLQKDLVANKAALKALSAAFTENRISTDELYKGQVRLKQEATNLTTEQRALNKANEQQAALNRAAAGSVDELKAKSALLTREYNALGEAQKNGLAGEEVTARLAEVNKALADAGVKVNDFRRNVGNYGGAINELIPQLVKLQEQQKHAAPDSAAYQETAKQIGFVTKAAQDAGAKMGLTADQTAAKLKGVGDAIRPATAEVVKLEQEQAKLEKGSEAYNQIGFKVNKLNKEIAQAPAALHQVEQATEGVKTGFGAALSQGLAPFQGQLDRGAGILSKYKSGTELVKQGLVALQPAGETGALGFKSIAAGIALTGIGLFVLALSAVVSYFMQTNEGGKLLKQGLAGLGAVVTTVANLFTGAGKSLVEVFKNPKVALNSLLEFLKGQVVNRLAAFGVLIDGIRNRDFRKITDSVIQFNLGITNGTEKAVAYAKQVGNVALAAKDLEAQQQALKKSRAALEADEILEKGRVEELIRLSKDRTLSAGDRLGKLREAGKLEGELSAKSLAQITAELTAIKQRNEAKGLQKTADEIQEERDKQKEYNATVVERNNTLATIKARQSRFILEEAAELKTAQKARADAAQKAREDAVRAKQVEAELLLSQTEKGSAAELAVRQRLVQLAADLELAAAKKTAKQKELIQINANQEIQKLAEEYNQKQLELAKKATEATEKERVREYNEAKQHLDDYLAQKRAAVESDFAQGKISQNTYEKDLNALEKAGLEAELVNAKDYSEKTGAIEKKQADNEIKEAQRVKNEKKKIKDTEVQIVETALQAGLTASDAVVEAFGKESDAGQAALVVKKTLALADIAIQTEKQIQLNHTTAAEIKASIPPPLGVALGIAYEIAEDALTISAGAASAAKILGFNTGGIVPGQGSTDTVPAVLTPNEIILHQGVAQKYPEMVPVLSSLNAMVGGVNFAPGFTPSPPAQIDGGLTARAVAGGVAIDYNKFAAASAMHPINVNYVTAGDKYAARKASIGRFSL